MNASDTYFARTAHKLSNLTSQIFCCRGLQHTVPGTDRLGNHDLLYWLIFLTVLTGWFLFLFLPQRERVELLTARLDTLNSHLKEEQKELRRLQSGIADLLRGDPYAWERAARGHLGWVEPGEMTDMKKWNQDRLQAQERISAPPGAQIPPQTARPAPALTPRPAIPALPLPLLPVHLQTADSGTPQAGPPHAPSNQAISPGITGMRPAPPALQGVRLAVR